MEEQKSLGVDLSTASKDMIEALLAEVADTNLFDEILRTNRNRYEIIELLIENPETPNIVREEAAKILQVPAKPSTAMAKSERHHGEKHEVQPKTLLQKVQDLSVSERRLLAMRGGREVRSILFKDTNKEVMMSVLGNPKITESEIEIIAHSRSIPDEALRAITKNREWMKNYGIVLSVVTNPKTPAGVAIPLLSTIKLRDLVILEKNRNVAEALRSAAKKLIHIRKPS